MKRKLLSPLAASPLALKESKVDDDLYCAEDFTDSISPISHTVPTSSGYITFGQIGSGAYSRVYLCEKGGVTYAMKKQQNSVGEDLDTRVHYTLVVLNEVNALRKLGSHKSIVSIVEVFCDPRYTYIVMDHFEMDLAKYISEKGKYTVKHMMKQILDGLNHAHKNGFIHRDMKPSNILINSDGNLVIADWGMSRSMPLDGVAFSDMVTTQWYRAPELMLGCPTYGTEIDIWSVGCIMVELITGRPLFRGRDDDENDQLDKIFKVGGIPDNKIWPELNTYTTRKFKFVATPPDPSFLADQDEDLRDIVLKMLKYRPCERITASDALEHPFFK